METTSQEQTPTQPLNTEQPSSKLNMWKAGFFVLLGLVLVSSILGYYFVTQSGKRELTPAPTVSESQKTEVEEPIPTEASKVERPEGLLVVNSHSSIEDERGPYFTFQLKYPSKYFTTSDDMVSSYITQGGMAPPRLIFTKNIQPLGEDTYWDIWNSSEDCLLVWSTSGFDSIEDFQNNRSTVGLPKTISQEQVTLLGSYQADKRVVKYSEKESNNLEVFVQLPETVAYFFQTCNMNSEEDLQVLLDNFKVRAFDIEN